MTLVGDAFKALVANFDTIFFMFRGAALSLSFSKFMVHARFFSTVNKKLREYPCGEGPGLRSAGIVEPCRGQWVRPAGSQRQR